MGWPCRENGPRITRKSISRIISKKVCMSVASGRDDRPGGRFRKAKCGGELSGARRRGGHAAGDGVVFLHGEASDGVAGAALGIRGAGGGGVFSLVGAAEGAEG